MLEAALLLSSKERMTLEVGEIFWSISHTMLQCHANLEGLGIHIYSWPNSQAYAKMLV